jgi:hypothetical protein
MEVKQIKLVAFAFELFHPEYEIEKKNNLKIQLNFQFP